MKRMRQRFALILIAALVLICSPVVPARAEDGSYTYTVRFYSGQQGTFAGGQEVITYEGLSYGSVVTFNPNGGVTLKDGSKYYIKGIRESGRDNNTVSASSFVVTGDRDYVVAYGLRGNVVAYTVNYLDMNGQELAPSDTYYGNVGDKPVVAFLYIDGYLPQAYNLTKTLSANEAENVFTFIYSPLSGYETDMIMTTVIDPGTERTIVEVIPSETIRRQGTSRTTQVSSEETEDADASANASVNPGAETVGEPLEGIDLDGLDLEDPAVPLADRKFKLGPIEIDARMLLVMIVILTSLLVVSGASYWYWKPYRKKEKNEEESNPQPV